ncbi:MAG: acyltransferase family protein [Pseudoclavibacter sp.]
MLTAPRRRQKAQRASGQGLEPRTGYVPEIQGLRTLALVLVAVFHIWFDRVSGGVDIFLMISAFLMTRSLADRAVRGGLTNPVTFLIRKFSRLIPAAVVVIAMTLGGIVLFMPAAMWPGFVTDAMASLGYVENFRLQAVGADYFNANAGVVSPFQHFWSLSIQGQIFILWAVTHLVAELFARLTRIPVRTVLFVGFGAVFVLSLGRSVWLTDFNQSYAYFDTVSRMWEFAAGSLIALVHGTFHASRIVRETMRWVGLAGVLSCAMLAPVESTFPGWIALWPVVSAALIILSTDSPISSAPGSDTASQPEGGGMASRLLSSPTLGIVSDHTYALYLVHWPVLVIFTHVAMTESPNWWQGAVILAISVALSVMVHWIVERPVSTWLKRVNARNWATKLEIRPLVAITTGAALVVVTGVVVNQQHQVQIDANEQALALADFSQIGANAPDIAVPSDSVIPDESLVLTDWASMGQKCNHEDKFTPEAFCYHLPAVPEIGDTRSLLAIGNSHVAQLSGLIYETASRQPTWDGFVQVAPDCTYERSLGVNAPAGCPGLWPGAERYIVEHKPDLGRV